MFEVDADCAATFACLKPDSCIIDSHTGQSQYSGLGRDLREIRQEKDRQRRQAVSSPAKLKSSLPVHSPKRPEEYLIRPKPGTGPSITSTRALRP